MEDELARARDFDGVRSAGARYGQRIGPTVARIVVMVATYGIAKFSGLFKGSILDLPGGSRAAALAERQGFRLAEAETARSIALADDGSVTIDLGTSAAMTAADPNKLNHVFANPDHRLDPLVAKYGSEEAAFDAVKTAAQEVVATRKITGLFKITVEVDGLHIMVKGNVIDGIVRIGSFWAL